MKYRIEGDYKDNTMEGAIEIQDADKSDLKDFIIYGMPGLIQDLFDKFSSSLKERAKEGNISEDKILGVISLMSIMCQNTLSEKLTESLNKLVGELDGDSEELETKDQNLWTTLSE